MGRKKPVIVLAISGASGSLYGKEIFEALFSVGIEIHLIITDTATKIMKDEISLDLSFFSKPGVICHDNHRFDVPVASGSFLTSGMVIAPCSMGCLGRIASGVSSDLLTRVADVHLKEGRKLILLPRETPLSAIHLENMFKLSRAGATIMPPMPPHTSRPASVADMAKIMASRVLDQLGIENDLSPRYEGAQRA
ncbi:MAG: UbiX family flavin prenyltransferase [Nitrospinota bacterium]|nr:UbiX family flavin prenyltransferase [Nitrospinota bacterium]